MKKILSKIFLIVFCLAVFLAGFAFGRSSVEKPSEKVLNNIALGQPSNIDFSLFWDAWNLIESKYVKRGELERQKMVYGAISGLLGSLGDPYSTFFTPQENENFEDELQGVFEGIGVEIGIRDNVLTVIAPLEGTPAKRAGLLSGDKILKIGDISTEGLSLDEAVTKIKGKKGTAVKLTVLKAQSQEIEDVEIVRDVIDIPVLKTEIKDNYAYIQIYSFTENINSEFKKEALKILQGDVSGIILDLRGNPGGYFERAIDIAGWFLPKDGTVVSEDYGNEEKIVHQTDGPASLSEYPLVVLIDEGSASASEILAGALKDHNRAELVGQKSFGKGSIQELQRLGGGSAVKITIARWLTPSGHSIDGEGIEPNFMVEFTREEFEAGLDPQKEKAVEILKEKMSAQ